MTRQSGSKPGDPSGYVSSMETPGMPDSFFDDWFVEWMENCSTGSVKDMVRQRKVRVRQAQPDPDGGCLVDMRSVLLSLYRGDAQSEWDELSMEEQEEWL